MGRRVWVEGGKHGRMKQPWKELQGYWNITSLHFFLSFFFNFFFKDFIFPFSPKAPRVHSCVFLTVSPSCCGIWDAALAWLDERCHVRTQDSNWRNPGTLKRSVGT